MGEFSKKEVSAACDFAKGMVGNHATDLIGARTDWEVFRDDIRGKLGEIALEKYVIEQLKGCEINQGVDYQIMPRGQWDTTDLIVNQKYLNVKTIGERANYLMVECFRYDDNGNYVYRNNNGSCVRVDAYVLVKVVIKPEIDQTDFDNRNDVDFKNLFKQRGGGRTIRYEVLGAIDHQEFWTIKSHAPQGMKCITNNFKKVESNDYESLEMIEDGPDVCRNQRLQIDNFILHKQRLRSLETVLKKHS